MTTFFPTFYHSVWVHRMRHYCWNRVLARDCPVFALIKWSLRQCNLFTSYHIAVPSTYPHLATLQCQVPTHILPHCSAKYLPTSCHTAVPSTYSHLAMLQCQVPWASSLPLSLPSSNVTSRDVERQTTWRDCARIAWECLKRHSLWSPIFYEKKHKYVCICWGFATEFQKNGHSQTFFFFSFVFSIL